MNHEISCPNASCVNPKSFYRNGYYRSKSSSQYFPKYQCRSCKTYFSFRKTRDELEIPFYKVDRLKTVYDSYCSGETQRRIAVILQKRQGAGSRNSVARYFSYLASKAKEHHERMITAGKLKTNNFQFDEMETYQLAKVNMLSIVVSVCAKTGRIISLNACEIKCKGKLAQTIFGQQANQWRVDGRRNAFKLALDRMENVCGNKGPITITSDSKRTYISLFRDRFLSPAYQLFHQPVKARSAKSPRTNLAFKIKTMGGVKIPDPMFWLNHLCATIRADMSRMRRKSWTTTKKVEKLQEHLDLFTAFYNGYELEDMIDPSGGKMRLKKTLHSKRRFKEPEVF